MWQSCLFLSTKTINCPRSSRVMLAGKGLHLQPCLTCAVRNWCYFGLLVNVAFQIFELTYIGVVNSDFGENMALTGPHIFDFLKNIVVITILSFLRLRWVAHRHQEGCLTWAIGLFYPRWCGRLPDTDLTFTLLGDKRRSSFTEILSSQVQYE